MPSPFRPLLAIFPILRRTWPLVRGVHTRAGVARAGPTSRERDRATMGSRFAFGDSQLVSQTSSDTGYHIKFVSVVTEWG
eukprot:3402472-Prymnesium_polylepis.1